MNPFRPAYRELTEVEKSNIDVIKRIALELYTHIDAMNESREKSISKTKLEESVMWAVKGLTA